MTDRGALHTVSPLDGRYAAETEALVPYASEAALMRARVRVEVEYLLALAELAAIPLEIDDQQRAALRAQYREFDDEDAATIKQLEKEGWRDYAATNHDVKAVEYYLRESLPDDLEASQWIHFGLTSEDVTNIAYRLLIGGAVSEVLEVDIHRVREELSSMAREYRDVAMLARTHGQPATPTTFGKEMAVYAARLGRTLARVRRTRADLSGKLSGASGTYAAHAAAVPAVDWRAFARSFVRDLGLEHEPLTTQVNPGDDLAALFDALRGVNNVLEDLAVDAWLYVSDQYLGQAATAGETGSSTMPHKVNPIDFENAEGNLAKASTDLTFLADTLTTSRLQRDLSDSTVKRNVGTALAHCRIGYLKCCAGLESVVPNESVMQAELAANPAVIGEAIQTILRREGHDDAYEQVKAATRGRDVTVDDLQALVDDLPVSDAVRAELLALSPETYTGLADELVDELE